MTACYQSMYEPEGPELPFLVFAGRMELLKELGARLDILESQWHREPKEAQDAESKDR